LGTDWLYCANVPSGDDAQRTLQISGTMSFHTEGEYQLCEVAPGKKFNYVKICYGFALGVCSLCQFLCQYPITNAVFKNRRESLQG